MLADIDPVVEKFKKEPVYCTLNSSRVILFQ